MQEDKQILLVAQKSADVDDPSEDDMHEVGHAGEYLAVAQTPQMARSKFLLKAVSGLRFLNLLKLKTVFLRK